MLAGSRRSVHSPGAEQPRSIVSGAKPRAPRRRAALRGRRRSRSAARPPGLRLEPGDRVADERRPDARRLELRRDRRVAPAPAASVPARLAANAPSSSAPTPRRSRLPDVLGAGHARRRGRGAPRPPAPKARGGRALGLPRERPRALELGRSVRSDRPLEHDPRRQPGSHHDLVRHGAPRPPVELEHDPARRPPAGARSARRRGPL